MAADLLAEIRRIKPFLPHAEQKVADFICIDPRQCVEYSIGALAEKSGVGSATVARFTQSLGFSGYRQFRLALAAATSRDDAARDHFDIDGGEIEPQDNLQELVRKIAYQEVQAIQNAAEAIDLTALETSAQAISNASRIDLYGFGSSSLTAQDLYQKFSRIGLYVSHSPDIHVALASASLLNKDSVAIGVSHSGMTKGTVQCLAEAQRAGALTISLSNSPESVLVKSSDISLTTLVKESRFRSGAMSSRIAQLAIVDMLFVRVAQSRFSEISDALEKTYFAVQPHRILNGRRTTDPDTYS